MKKVKTIDELNTSGKSLLRLKDGRVALCSPDKRIRIHDPSNDYHCDQGIYRYGDYIDLICELDDGTIVSCSSLTSITIFFLYLCVYNSIF